MLYRNYLLLVIFFFIGSLSSFCQEGELDFSSVLSYRNLSPFRTGSWISSIAVPHTENKEYKNTYYVSGRYGGVWKTTNNGTTFIPVFDSVGVSSIGAIGISSSDPEQVWIGTGEAYNARSTHAGEGVFFSKNGGENWESKGLEDTHHISTLIVHPTNPDVVFVAAMGHLFTPNEQRGVFKTNDGGNSWEKVLFVDENTGVIDLIINPENPDILFAAAYEKYRSPWHYEAGGEKSGIYKSPDGGDSWERISSGLPNGKLGRIGLALCYKQPNIVYTVIENLNPKKGIEVDESIRMNQLRDPYFDQLIGGEVYRSNDNGNNWKKMNTDSCNMSAKAAYSFNKIMVSPDDPNRITISSDALLTSLDGGKTWLDCTWPQKHFFLNMFGDIRSFWVNPEDGNHMMIGSDGGLYVTYDGGISMEHKYLPLNEIYTVETDNATPYNIYLGLQDHEAWKGPVNSWSGNVGFEDWRVVGMWDGMYTKVDPVDNRWLYTTTQFGAHQRVDQKTGTRIKIEPMSPDTIRPYRYAWTPPLAISHHNHQTIYTGGQMLLKSTKQGENWEEISPDLTTNNPGKIAGKGHMMYCTITAISESPLSEGSLWVGTDDGRIHSTNNNGKTWTEFTAKIAALGGKKDYWVSRIVCSMHNPKRAFVTKSGFRNDDFEALAFKTEDNGKTWIKITNGLPVSPVNVVREDPKNPNLLYLGNDKGVYISFDQGNNWQALKINMPSVPVKDLKIHARENDLIVGTYGRGAYICDVSLIQQLPEKLNRNLLFDIEPKPQRNFSEQAWWGNYELMGDNHLSTPNEPNGLVIYYYLHKNYGTKPKMEIANNQDELIQSFDLEGNTKGLHKTIWNTVRAKPGSYKITLNIDGKVFEKTGIVTNSPVWPVGTIVH